MDIKNIDKELSKLQFDLFVDLAKINRYESIKEDSKKLIVSIAIGKYADKLHKLAEDMCKPMYMEAQVSSDDMYDATPTRGHY